MAWTLERDPSTVGASDVPALVGRSPWSSAQDVVDRIHGRVSADSVETEPMVWGAKIEPLLLDEAEHRLGMALYRQQGMQHVLPSGRILHATLDGYCDGVGPVEAKCVQTSRWPADGPVPAHIWWQVQTQLLVTGADVGRVIALHDGAYVSWHEVPVNPQAEDRIIEVVEQAYANKLPQRPDFNGHDLTARQYLQLNNLHAARAKMRNSQDAERARRSELLDSLGDVTGPLSWEGQQVGKISSYTTRRLDRSRLEQENPWVTDTYLRESTTTRVEIRAQETEQ